jgi:hypothetical protein
MLATSDLSPYADHAHSSKLPLYGLPASVAAVFVVEKKLGSFIKKALEEFQDQVRTDARSSWGDVADTINIVYNENTEEINIYSTSPRAQILEYGGDGQPPRPVLRKAAYSAQQRVAERVSRMISEALF